MAEDEDRLFAALQYELRDGPAVIVLQADGTLENELLLLRCKDGVEALGTDVQLMGCARVVEGGAAFHAEMNGAADCFSDPDDLARTLLGGAAGFAADGHEVDDFGHAFIAEEARDEDIGVG